MEEWQISIIDNFFVTIGLKPKWSSSNYVNSIFARSRIIQGIFIKVLVSSENKHLNRSLSIFRHGALKKRLQAV